MFDHKHEGQASSDKKLAKPTIEERSIAPTETASIAPSESASNAPLVDHAAHGAEDAAGSSDEHPRRKSLFQRFKDERAERKAQHRNYYDNGPYQFVFDPVQGKEVLMKNPHWPYEDSYERENVGLTVKKGMEGAPDFVKQQTGKWGQTSDSSAQEYWNGTTAGIL
ncbi:hypothetical protein LTR78_001704 [Recurvomyces mirabilis]|uniref:Uncharacterized protein n=1 Tax=Recurvomyces mirabilis TaxID=574656 RepID=A0AAE1C532_9PEZI|nr:hypothetical protein LTR78_001704 [Recurvomyces mirabilis]KAK5150222.1 hypothetical protein LTS14_010351 [Recurvomyces mirabilis]